MAGPVRADPRHHASGRSPRSRWRPSTPRCGTCAACAPGEPLWRAGRRLSRERVPLYDTEGGWLHLSHRRAGRRRAAPQRRPAGRGEAQGRQAARRTRTSSGCGRTATRSGPDFDIMVDANQSMTRRRGDPAGGRCSSRSASVWFEEPLPADDVAGHVRLAALDLDPGRGGRVAVLRRRSSASTSQRGAAGIVQVDVARDRRDHAVAEGRASGRGVQRRGVPALPDGAARQPGGRGAERAATSSTSRSCGRSPGRRCGSRTGTRSRRTSRPRDRLGSRRDRHPPGRVTPLTCGAAIL